jgi:exopolysaccharide production protein ExoZ
MAYIYAIIKLTSQNIMNRLYNLDYLRGLAAFGIMIYHYLSWTLGNFSADTFMGRLGIYGVSIFYVLSGLTLYYVYFDKMKPSKEDIISFFKKKNF